MVTQTTDLNVLGDRKYVNTVNMASERGEEMGPMTAGEDSVGWKEQHGQGRSCTVSKENAEERWERRAPGGLGPGEALTWFYLYRRDLTQCWEGEIWLLHGEQRRRGNNSIHLGVSAQMMFKSLRLDEIIMGAWIQNTPAPAKILLT